MFAGHPANDRAVGRLFQALRPAPLPSSRIVAPGSSALRIMFGSPSGLNSRYNSTGEPSSARASVWARTTGTQRSPGGSCFTSLKNYTKNPARTKFWQSRRRPRTYAAHRLNYRHLVDVKADRLRTLAHLWFRGLSGTERELSDSSGAASGGTAMFSRACDVTFNW